MPEGSLSNTLFSLRHASAFGQLEALKQHFSNMSGDC